LNTADSDTFDGNMLPGTSCTDAPIQIDGKDTWLLNQLGDGFTLLSFGPSKQVQVGNVMAKVLTVGKDIDDIQGLVKLRYDGKPGTVYLIRPDQHIAARWREFDSNAVEKAIQRALKLN
jgi:3-(3-hydroxy-phenyl)propionate hydroxylase